MKVQTICAVLLAATATTVWAGQPTSNDFLPIAKLKKYTNFLGFDRDKGGMPELEVALQNSGTNWHCTSDSHELRCPLSGDTGSTGTNVAFRTPHAGEGGVMVADFRVTLLFDDKPTLDQLQPSSAAAALLGQDWSSVLLDLGKPTNNYDDGSTTQHLYCSAGEIIGKPNEARTARVYVMFVDVTRVTNKIVAVELAAYDQVLTGLNTKPSC